MSIRPIRQRFVTGLGLLAAIGLAALLPAPAPAVQGTSGLDVFRTNCDGCHELPDPDDPKRSRAEWEGVLNKMVKEKGASLDQREFRAVLDYLDSFNLVRAAIAWVERPATSHQAGFEAGSVGKLPAPWVSQGTKSAADAAWALQQEAGKTLFLAPSQGTVEGKSQLLIDNSGTVLAGKVSTRLRIAAGKVGGGAGMVFGFRSPQAYFGVRANPQTKDVVLYEASQGDRALVGRGPLSVPAGEWLALAVDLKPNLAQVLVNEKPAFAARRLPGYRGGRVGLLTEGAAIAGFDRWSVEVPKP